MNIHLHIERLVLDGLPIASIEAARVQAAVEAELGRLLANGFSAPASLAQDRIAGGEIQMGPGARPHELGRAIGQSVFASLGSSGFDRNHSTQTNNQRK